MNGVPFIEPLKTNLTKGENQLKPNVMLTITSLLAILFMSIHLADDILRNQNGVGQGGFMGLVVVLVLIVWLYGVLVLSERRWGYVINLVGSLLASYVAFGHITGMGDVVVGEIAKSSGGFFAWVVVALGVTAIFSLILSARALWSPIKDQSQSSNNPKMEKPVARRK
jgi:hypothetical protein